MTPTKPARRQYRFGFYLPQTPSERSYSFVVLFSAGTIFLSRFLTDGPPVAFIFLVSVALGFFFNWRKMPMIGIVLLAYFVFAPLLIPIGPPVTSIFRLNHFEPMTVIVAVASLIYVASQYRLYGLVDRAMPADARSTNKKQPDPNLRQIDLIPSREIVGMIAVIVIAVLAAEAFYLLVTELYFEPFQENFPVRWAGRVGMETQGMPGAVVPWLSRLVLTAVGLMVMTFIARMIFWYWRLVKITPEEGTAIVADIAWAENHPEHRRNELWRAWAKAKAARRSKR